MHPLLSLGPLRLPSYGVALAVSILVGVLWTARRAGRMGLPQEQAFRLASLAALAAVIGGRLPAGLAWDNSGVFLVGFLCAVLTVWIGARLMKADFWTLCDAAAPALALGVAIVRAGCLAAGCDYGKPAPSDFSWAAVVFHNAAAHADTGVPLGVPLHPTQIYESLLGLLILAALMARNWTGAARGAQMRFFVFAYCAGRFLIEFYRGDAGRGFLGPLSTSQWLALGAGLVFLGLPKVRVAALAAVLLLWPAPASASDLETGFQQLYNLRFSEAQQVFRDYQEAKPGDPLGPAAEAAGLAFREFHRLGLLASKNFLGSRPAIDGPALMPDAQIRRDLMAALERAEAGAEQRLKTDPRDADAWFALTLAQGLRADYAYLVEKRGLAALMSARQSDAHAKRLLAIAPEYFDAYLPLGVTNYILGSLPGVQRFVLRLGGVSGNKRKGLEQLEVAAQKGRLLQPFARILLALIAVREKQPERARPLLLQLQEQFPGNTIFASELAALGPRERGTAGSR